MGLTRDQILQADDIAIKEIEVEEWGGVAYIRQLTRGEQDAYMERRFKPSMSQKGREQQISSTINLFGHDAWLVAQGICDEDGKRLFETKHVKELEKKSGEVVGRIAKEILEHSGMKEDVEELDNDLGDREEEELKN